MQLISQPHRVEMRYSFSQYVPNSSQQLKVCEERASAPTCVSVREVPLQERLEDQHHRYQQPLARQAQTFPSLSRRVENPET